MKSLKPPPGTYSIHAGSYQKQQMAVLEAKRMKGMGFDDVYALKADLKEKGVWYRVYIGKYRTKTAAQAAMTKLKQKDSGINCLVVKNR